MKRIAPIFLVLSASLASALSLVISPADDLKYARRMYVEATNSVASGMFREAENYIGIGMNKANGRLNELEKRTATLGMLHEFDLRIQDCLDRFEDNWTNAVLAALSIQEPFRAFVETNTVIQPKQDMSLQGLEWLKQELDSDNKRDAKVNLSNFQKALHRQISACEDIRTIEGDFRAVLVDLERVRSELQVERGKPLDVRRALRTARRHVAEAKRKIDSPGTEFVGATCDIECAKNYAADVRVAGGQGRDLARVESSIVETERLLRLRYFRQHMQEARDWMAKERPRDALNSIRICEQSDLPALRTDIEYNVCRDEMTELKCAADKMAENQENAEREAAIAKVREQLGDPKTRVLDQPQDPLP